MLAAADFLIGQPSDSTAIHYAEGDDQNEQHGAEGGLYFCSPAEPEYFSIRLWPGGKRLMPRRKQTKDSGG